MTLVRVTSSKAAVGTPPRSTAPHRIAST